MRKVHRLSEVTAETAVCSICGPVKVWSRKSYPPTCWTLRERKRTRDAVNGYRGRSYRKVVYERLQTMTCERCGFVAEDICQLDVDHILPRNQGGSDHPDNLAVLCANCHRLKTKQNGDTHDLSR